MGTPQKARSHYRFHNTLLYCDYVYVLITNLWPLAISIYFDKVLGHCFPRREYRKAHPRMDDNMRPKCENGTIPSH